MTDAPRLDPAKLDAVKTIITHDSCADGTASAILLQDAFYGRGVKVRFLQYGTPEFKALTPEPGLLFCDFAPTADTAQSFVDAGALILDHHKGAQKVVESFGSQGVFADERLDVGSCGASLAFQHVWLPRRGDMTIQRQFAEDLATLAGIRDTWQRQDPRWKEACQQANVLHFLPNDKWLSRTLTDIASVWRRDFKPIGEILWEKNEKRIDRAVKNAYHFTTDIGTRVAVINGLSETSDSAEALGSEVDLIVGVIPINEDGVSKYLCSTRSHTTFDCSTFAKSFGGGGHTKAAGFNIAFDVDNEHNIYAFVKLLVNRYENPGSGPI